MAVSLLLKRMSGHDCGRELHDDLGQRTALLGIQIDRPSRTCEVAREQTPGGDVENADKELNSDIQHISHELHPAKVGKHLGLIAAVKALCRDVSAHSDIGIECRLPRCLVQSHVTLGSASIASCRKPCGTCLSIAGQRTRASHFCE